MPKKYDVVAITGTYNEKPIYRNVGAVIEKDGKFYLKIDSLAFHEDGRLINFFSLYSPKAKEENPPKQAATKSEPDFDDNIPF